MNMQQFAMQLINSNPQIRNNPRNADMIRAIENWDERSGAEIANNLCNTYGANQNEAVNRSMQYFGFGGR